MYSSSLTKSLAKTAVTTLAVTLGHRTIRQLIHFAKDELLCDNRNTPKDNGTMLLVRRSLLASPNRNGIHVADIGANVGEWAALIATAANEFRMNQTLTLHAFEPCASTYAVLVRSTATSSISVIANKMACGNEPGTMLLNVVAPLCGRNSLLKPIDTDSTLAEHVEITTLDLYMHARQLPYLHLVKIDAEGYDLRVLLGARKALRDRRIGVIQFEYNKCWIDDRRYLRDAFDIAEDVGYAVCKLTRQAIVHFQKWNVRLETFGESNWCLVNPEILSSLSPTSW